MTDTLYDRAPGETSDGNEGGKPSGVLIYTIGLLGAVILTATSFWAANTPVLWGPGVALGLAVLHGQPQRRHDAASRLDEPAHAALTGC